MNPKRSRLDAVLQALAAMLWAGAYCAALVLIWTLLVHAVPWLRQRSQSILIVGLLASVLLGRGRMYLGPPAFPFWRATLALNDRRTLVGAAMVGALLGLMVGVLGSLVLLDPTLSSPSKSTNATAGIILSIIGASFLASFGVALRVPGSGGDPEISITAD